jgi:hypothetical protein
MRESDSFLAKEVETIPLKNNKLLFIIILKDPKIRRPPFSKKQYLKENLALYSC